MKGKSAKLGFLILFLVFQMQGKASEYTMEDLEILRSRNILTQEEYEILRDELQGTSSQNGEILYSLVINGRIKSNLFMTIQEGEKQYFPLMRFFEIIRFRNYEKRKDEIKMLLGKELEPLEINFAKGVALKGKKKVKIEFEKSQIRMTEDEIYIEQELFKELFLNSLETDKKKYSMKMNLNFTTPPEIDTALENSLDLAYSKEVQEELFYTNGNRWFDLGYTRVNVQAELSKDRGEKFTTGWTGDLEYQGGLLLGEFTTSYDVKEKELGDTYLYYPEIYRGHSLELGSYGSQTREWGASLKKEKGYFYEGKDIVIKENVPIGSRVELLYLGFPIDVKQVDDGIAEFRNSEIKSDRIYVLRVYTPDGRIYEIPINTAVDFRQQNAGQTEYDFRIREDHESKKYTSEANVYYGITESLTFGLGYTRMLEEEDEDKTRYVDTLTEELVYSDTIFRAPYTLVGGLEHGTFRRTKQYIEAQVEMGDFLLRTEQNRYGRYYDESLSRVYTLEYNPGTWYTFDTNYYKTHYHGDETEKDYDVGVSIYRNIMRDLLVTTEFAGSKNNGNEYTLNIYYTGFHSVNTRFNNRWYNDGKEYETALTLMNKNLWDIFDFTLEFSYSSSNDSKFTFRFDLDYDNWLSAGIFADGQGAQSYKLGLDKVMDLKNIRSNIESMDSSRVKAITFVDANKNNIYDPGEERVDNVEIKIGSQTEVTDEKGEAYFFGVPNGILYDLKPKIRKPSYSLGNTKITLRGKNTGTIEAYIPIKPMVTLTGAFIIDEALKLNENEKREIYENTLVRIIDSDGKTLENTLPDEYGIFHISGLLPEKYTLEILYLGERFNIPTMREDIELKYEKEDSSEMVLKFMEKGIALLKEGKV